MTRLFDRLTKNGVVPLFRIKESGVRLANLNEADMRLILLFVVASLVLVACGTKGPLYLPEKQYPQTQQDSK